MNPFQRVILLPGTQVREFDSWIALLTWDLEKWIVKIH